MPSPLLHLICFHISHSQSQNDAIGFHQKFEDCFVSNGESCRLFVPQTLQNNFLFDEAFVAFPKGRQCKGFFVLLNSSLTK